MCYAALLARRRRLLAAVPAAPPAVPMIQIICSQSPATCLFCCPAMPCCGDGVVSVWCIAPAGRSEGGGSAWRRPVCDDAAGPATWDVMSVDARCCYLGARARAFFVYIFASAILYYILYPISCHHLVYLACAPAAAGWFSRRLDRIVIWMSRPPGHERPGSSDGWTYMVELGAAAAV